MLETALDNLADAGRLLVVGYISEYPHRNADGGRPAAEAATMAEKLFWSGDTVMRGKQTIRGNVWPKGDRQPILQAKEEVFRLHREGELTALVDARRFHGLDSIPDALEHMLSGTTVGKVVVEL